jgi:hypothetical protein
MLWQDLHRNVRRLLALYTYWEPWTEFSSEAGLAAGDGKQRKVHRGQKQGRVVGASQGSRKAGRRLRIQNYMSSAVSHFQRSERKAV